MQSLFISERTTEHSNNTVMSFDWCQCRAASVSRNRSWYTGPPTTTTTTTPTSTSPHCSDDHRGLLTFAWPHSNSNAAGPFFTDSEGPTITARLFNAKPGLTSWPHLAPAFCGQERTGLMFLGAVCSRLLMWNNIGITSRVKHQHIQVFFCSAVLIATCKQRHYRLPQFCPTILSALLCIVLHFVFVA